MESAIRVGCRPGRTNPLHPALWRWNITRSWKSLLASVIVLHLFSWLFVWLMSLFKGNFFADVLSSLPDFLTRGLGEDMLLYATKTGQISIIFRHLVTLLICVGWAVGRGSDAVAGEISRGTMEHLLALPVRRVTVLVVPTIVTTVGCALMAAAVWVGVVFGLATVKRFAELSARDFIPGAVNLFTMTFCMAGIATLLSSIDHDRWRTIWLSVAVFVVSMIVFMVGFFWPEGRWVLWGSFLSAFQPQDLVLKPDVTWSLPLGPLGSVTASVAFWYNSVLVGLGVACYAVAAAVFVRRDIPLSR